jgi:endonuclease/exonuclease/phosphatase family metal-dependent hydrolase
VRLTFASYNIHKGVGLDRRRDPDRILGILREIDADVIALQEADRRFGTREAVLSRQAILEHSPWRPIAPNRAMTGRGGGARPASIGWHGNVLLVRREIAVDAVGAVPLPTLEPRGAICADLRVGQARLRVVGMHLDLSGLRRRHQLQAICDHVERCAGAAPTVLMGDMNEWSAARGAFRGLEESWRLRTGAQLSGAAAGGPARPDRGERRMAGGRPGRTPQRAVGGRFRSSARLGAPGAAACLKIRQKVRFAQDSG